MERENLEEPVKFEEPENFDGADLFRELENLERMLNTEQTHNTEELPNSKDIGFSDDRGSLGKSDDFDAIKDFKDPIEQKIVPNWRNDARFQPNNPLLDSGNFDNPEGFELTEAC